MGLNDLMTEIKTDPNSFLGDEPVENKVLNQVLALVEDKISEVKNQAVKWSIYLFYCVSRSTEMCVVWVNLSKSSASRKWILSLINSSSIRVARMKS